VQAKGSRHATAGSDAQSAAVGKLLLQEGKIDRLVMSSTAPNSPALLLLLKKGTGPGDRSSITVDPYATSPILRYSDIFIRYFKDCRT
jgi:hypothetical protein